MLKDVKVIVNEMFQNQLEKDTLNPYLEISESNNNNIIYARYKFNIYNEFTSSDAGLTYGKDRMIFVDKASGGGHGPRMKIYKSTSHGANQPCVILRVDKGKVINEGNKPKDIDMGSPELKCYMELCLRNWNLLCYCFNKGISADGPMLLDEQRRNNKDKPINIVRDADGGYRYKQITYDGPYGSKVVHNMVEYPGMKPYEER